MRRSITLLAALVALVALQACRPADASTYGKQTGAYPAIVSSPVTFNGGVSFAPSTADPAVWYRSGLLDFTTIADNISVGIPQRPGFIFCVNRSAILFRDGTGTGTAGNLSVTVGNNGPTNDNLSGPVASSFISFTQINGVLTHVPGYIGNGVGGTTSTPALLDSATQIVGKINTVVTGITSLHGYLLILGFWVPA